MTSSSKIASAIAIGALIASGVAPFAAFANSTEKDTCKQQAGIVGNVATSTVTVAQLIAYGDCRIDSRNTRLNDGITRVSQMHRLSDTIKSSLQSTLSGTENTLAGIKTKLDHDTDKATALADYRSIFTSVRVYALVLPRTWIIASSDRIQDTVAKLQQVSVALQTRNNGITDPNVQAANNLLIQDLNTNLVNAQAAATSFVSDVMALAPDQGDATVAASNKATLEAARAKIVAAKANLQTAIDDVAKVRATF